MAHALGQTARYRGNCDESIASPEHSVLVSLLMEHVVGGDPYEGILHAPQKVFCQTCQHHSNSYSLTYGKLTSVLKLVCGHISVLDRKSLKNAPTRTG